ncbi:MAG: DUF4097 family beta strand repeat-containing protein [Candidatus Acidiferrales bacterium]|jgi:DUF4097 and DUF4098 domain-containing protein YvlB
MNLFQPVLGYRIVKTSTVLGTILLCAGNSVAAPRHLEQRFKVDAHPIVTIHNPNGVLTVKAWSRPEVKLVADIQSDKVDFDAEQSGNRVEVNARAVSSSISPEELRADLQIFVPEDTELQIHDDSGSVDVADVMGDMAVDTIAAGVALEDAAGYLTIKTVGGSIQCVRCAGKLEITSVSGNIKLLEMRSYNVRAQTWAGDMFFDGEFLPNGTYRLKNYSGLIEVRFSPADSFDLSATSVRGKVDSQANLAPPPHSRAYESKFSHSLFGVLNQGKAKVELVSFDGTINIHKRD